MTASALSPGGYVRQEGRKNAPPPRAVNVQVALRCRPLNSRERQAGERTTLQCNSQAKEIVCLGPGSGQGGRIKPAAGNTGGLAGKKTYTYDHVFGPEATQEDVYENVVEPIVDEVLQGYNCTVFAYGQTGTGKTHTMEGRRDDDITEMADRRLPENAGIIPRSVKQIFDHLRSITDEHSVRVSHLELYNEQLTDLLGPEVEESNDSLRMFEDQQKGTFVQGLDEVLVRSEDEIFAVLDKSANKRRTAETLMNKYSSRSHSVFTVTIHIKESTPEGADLLKVGKLNLVDLAGSENVGRSGAVKGRAREAGNINQSLLTLGRVITSLVEKHPHIPYRDSKLTRLLQESLGGRNKTCVIATVTPGSSSIEETLSTLDYAHRAKSIKNRPTVNQMIAKHVLLKDYTEEIAKLKRELEATRTKNGIFLPPDEFDRLITTSKHQEDSISELELRAEESEKAVAATKEKLSKTQDALARTHGELRETQANLETTQSKLQETTEELRTTAQQRDEAAHVVNAQGATEATLYNQGKKLSHSLVEAVADVESLHKRVNARADAEKENMHRLKSAQELVSTELAQIDVALKDFARSENTALQRCTESSKSIAQSVTDEYSRATVVVGEICSALLGQLESFATEDLQHEEECSTKENTMIASCTEIGSTQIKELEKAIDHVQNLLTDQRERLAGLSSDVAVSREHVRGVLEGQSTAFADFVATHNARMHSVEKGVSECLAEQRAAIASAEEVLCGAASSHHDAVVSAKENALGQIAGILENLVGCSAASKTSMTQTVRDSCAKLAVSVDSTTTALESGHSGLRGECEQAVRQVQESVTTASAKACFASERVAALAQDASEAVAQHVDDVHQRLQAASAAGVSQDNACAALSKQLERHRTARRARRSALVDDNGQLVHSSRERVASSFGSASGAAMQASDGLSTMLASVANDTATIVDSVRTTLSGEVGDVIGRVTLTTDRDSHLAPVRKDWEPPAPLPRTRPHAELVSEYRTTRGLGGAPNFWSTPHPSAPDDVAANTADVADHEMLIDHEGSSSDGARGHSRSSHARTGSTETLQSDVDSTACTESQPDAMVGQLPPQPRAHVRQDSATTALTGAPTKDGRSDEVVLRDQTNAGPDSRMPRAAPRVDPKLRDDAPIVSLKRSSLRQPTTRRSTRARKGPM